MKKNNSIMRFLCVALAFVTFFAAAPFFAVESEAASTYDFDGAYYDFNDGTLGGSISGMTSVGSNTTGFTYKSSGNFTYCADPKDSTNVVLGLKEGATSAALYINDVNGLSLEKKIFVEARFYFESFTDNSTVLSIFAMTNQHGNKPMVALSKDGLLSTANCAKTTVYTDTTKTLELNTWYTLRMDIDVVGQTFDLYVDNELVATQALAAISALTAYRFLNTAGNWKAYVDDIKISAAHPNVFYDFNDGVAGSALTQSYLNKTAGLRGGSIANMVFCVDPVNENNIVLGRSSGKNNGTFYLNDDGALLASSTYTVEMKLYVKKMPTKDSGNSGDPLSLFTWNNGNGNIPLLRLKGDGTLIMAKKSTSSSNSTSLNSYNNTGKKLEAETWYDIKLDINAQGKYIALYINGEYAYSSSLPTYTTSTTIRFLQPNGVWEIYIDDISVKEYIAGQYDMMMDFEMFNEGQGLSNQVVSAAAFPMYANGSDSAGLKVTVDPDNADNKVSYHTGKGYYMSIYDNDLRLTKTDFVVSADFRFAEFPTLVADNGYADNLIFSWVNGSSPNYHFFCRVDSYGYLLDGAKNPTNFKFDKDKWYNVAVHCSGSTGKYDIYVDGEYICSGDVGTPSAKTQSYIRVLYYSSDSTKQYSAYVDDIMLYETPRIERTTAVSDVIWDIDFDEFNDGDKLTKDIISAASPVADYQDTTASWTGSCSAIATYNGSKALKITEATHEKQLDLCIGNGDFDPLKNGTVRFSMDLTFESLPSGNTLQLLRWRRMDLNGTKKTLNIIDFTSSGGKVNFLGKSTGFAVEVNKTYNFEIIFNTQIVGGTQYYDVSFYIENLTDGTGKQTIVSSYPMWRDTAMTMEGYSYLLDDAGVKHYLPYYGNIKSYKYDINGNIVTDASGNPILVDKMVNAVNPSTDVFRMFQGYGTLYIDNFIIEKIEDKPIVDTGFEGWNFNTFNYDMESQSKSRFYMGGGSIAREENGNAYVKLPNVYTDGTTNDQRHFWVGDKDKVYVGQNVYLETDVYLEAKSTATFASSSLMAIITQKKGSGSENNPFGWTSAGTGYGHLIHVDSDGKLYSKGSETTGNIGQLNIGGWTNIGIALSGDGEAWTEYSIYIDGELAYFASFSSDFITRQRNAKTMSFRFTNVKGAVSGYDNISIKPKVMEVVYEDISLDFEDEQATLNTVNKLGAFWRFGGIGSNRTQVLGTDNKYLHIDHENLTSDMESYVDIANSRFLGNDAYLLETSFRYSSKTAYGLTVASVYRPSEGISSSLLRVRGDSNKMFVTVRGVQYDVVNSANKLIYASKPTDEGFTNVAVLVNESNDTYTLYINGRLAYYAYDGQALPCVDLPMHFINDITVSGSEVVRLLEIPKVKYAESVLDVGYIKTGAMPNGIAAQVIGSQTRAVAGTLTYDIRFVSGLDSLYGSAVGFEVTAEYTDANGSYTKSFDVSSTSVFEKITADNKEITASDLNSEYLAAVEIGGIPLDIKVTFTVEPYMLRGGIRSYGESYSAIFENGALTK